jgi:hypothetical protein
VVDSQGEDGPRGRRTPQCGWEMHQWGNRDRRYKEWQRKAMGGEWLLAFHPLLHQISMHFQYRPPLPYLALFCCLHAAAFRAASSSVLWTRLRLSGAEACAQVSRPGQLGRGADARLQGQPPCRSTLGPTACSGLQYPLLFRSCPSAALPQVRSAGGFQQAWSPGVTREARRPRKGVPSR